MEPKDLTYELARCYFNDQRHSVSSELSNTVEGYFRSRSLMGLTGCSALFDPHSHGIDDWRFLRQIEAFFKKNKQFADEDECLKQAESSFWKSEQSCERTNDLLNELHDNPELIAPKIALQTHLAQHFIRSVLGDFNDFLVELPYLLRVTPGATTHSKRELSLPQFKLSLRPYCTTRAKELVKALYRFYGFKHCQPKTCDSNRVLVVPKNWKTHRTIACETEGNMPLQLAFDGWVKKRLRKYGINLSDQSANQRAAKRGSVDGSLATVDFEAASDTISYETVRWLMPKDWFQYLDRLRCPTFRGAFGIGGYNKFSSMGNGSTFAIETLVFAGLCKAVGSTRFLVYGDDVVIESDLYEEFTKLASFFGFTINSLKSFSTGPFRESCGKDYFEGIDVTPVYVRRLDNRKAVLCHTVNALRQVATPAGELEELLYKIVEQYKLPLIPWCENTMAGVFIDPVVARREKLLVFRKVRVDGPKLNYYKAYVPHAKHMCFKCDRSAYYLWFLRKSNQVLYAGPWDNPLHDSNTSITSSVPIFQHKYVRKWVVWCEPNNNSPVHLEWWTEKVLSARKGR